MTIAACGLHAKGHEGYAQFRPFSDPCEETGGYCYPDYYQGQCPINWSRPVTRALVCLEGSYCCFPDPTAAPAVPTAAPTPPPSVTPTG